MNGARQGSWRARFRAVLLPYMLYAATAAIALGANPFRGQTITPFDILISQRAWSFVDPSVQVRNYQRSDTLNWLLPQWTQARETIRDGRLPLWNDKIAGGGSSLTLSSTLFTPAFLIFAAVPDPPLGFYLAILFNLMVAGAGMHLLLRRHVGRVAAITGAMTFQLCGFNAAWLYWPHVFTLMWAPWLLLAVERCAERPGLSRALMVAAASALVLLGGFPFVSLLVFLASALYAATLFCFQWRDRAGPASFAGWYVAGTLLGIVLCALPLLSLASWLQQYDLGYRYGRGSYLDIHYWRQLFPPWAYQARRVEETMYVGAAMILSAIATLVGLVFRWRRAAALPLFAILLLASCAGLVFDLWPMWLVSWIPGMAFNSWSRAIGLMDIGLIILGAIGLQYLWNLPNERRKRWVRIAVLLVAAAQVTEMTLFFRTFNGPTSDDYYYPATPSIHYMRKHSGPFDYVVADKSFLMSGTLGAYGLREWLAHYFRSPALQAALHGMTTQPFNSHRASASRFPASDIRYGSPTMAAFNIRYLAVDSRTTGAIRWVAAARPHERRGALPPMPEHRFRQAFGFDASGGELAGIRVRLATYHRQDLRGVVTLQLEDTAGRPLAVATIDADVVKDNAFAEFRFTRPPHLGSGRYAFSLMYSPANRPARPLTAWSLLDKENHGDANPLQVDGRSQPGTLDYELGVRTASRLGPFREVFTAAGTSVLENRASPDGPYFIGAIDQIPNATSGRDIRLDDYRPARFSLTYAGSAAGFVVVPMSINGHWRVTMDGKPVHYLMKAGVLPAVPVSGPAHLDFTYEPAASRWLLPWLALLAGTLLAMGLASRRSDRQRYLPIQQKMMKPTGVDD